MLYLAFVFSVLTWAVVDCTVTQVHLSLTGNIATMGLDYVSDVAEATVVQYQDENSVVFDTYTSYIFRENIGYLHTASLSSLVPATHYNYRIGDGSDDGVWTEWFQFVTGPYVHTARDFSRKGDTNDATVGAWTIVFLL